MVQRHTRISQRSWWALSWRVESCQAVAEWTEQGDEAVHVRRQRAWGTGRRKEFQTRCKTKAGQWAVDVLADWMIWQEMERRVIILALHDMQKDSGSQSCIWGSSRSVLECHTPTERWCCIYRIWHWWCFLLASNYMTWFSALASLLYKLAKV